LKKLFDHIGAAEIRNALAIVTTLGGFILLYLMLIKEIPAGNKDVLNVAVGFVFGSGFTGVYGYYFGSSKGVTTPADQAPEQK